MRLIAITTCTDRKRFSPDRKLTARSLPTQGQSSVADIWLQRIASAPAADQADRVYCGRSMFEAINAAAAARTELRIISAGLGLVSASQKIPAYSLSVVRGSSDYVGSKVDGNFEPSEWWTQLQSGRRPLAALVRRNRDAVIAVGISRSYLPLVTADLLSLGDDLDRVRLIGLNIAPACDPMLRECVLPYDERFDGPDAQIPGTRGDFSSRALRHFAESVFPGNRSSCAAHSKAVTECLRRWRRPQKISRTPKTDAEILKVIRAVVATKGFGSGQSLRYLRDVKRFACEQSRFAELFRRATGRVRA